MRTGLYFSLVFGCLGTGAALAQTALLPQVVDSAGKSVGYLLSSNAVVLKVPGRPPLLTLFYSSGFLEPGGNQVYQQHYFKTADCSGKAYLLAAGAPLAAYVDPANNKLFEYPGTAAKTVFKSIQQYFNNSPPQCIATTTTVYAGPATSLTIGNLGFKPPFSIKFE